MKLLLLYLFVTLALAVRGANRGRAARTWPLLAFSVVVAAGYYSRRFI